MGNMFTLLAVGSEVSEALGCNQLVLLALYLACGWAGGLCAALLSNASTVGASGSVSGVIIALSVLKPTSAVTILGNVQASNPLMLLGGTLAADLSRRGVSWQAHFGGGAAGCLIAWVLKLVASL
jgi:membrane associated rhomboid family serine protease